MGARQQCTDIQRPSKAPFLLAFDCPRSVQRQTCARKLYRPIIRTNMTTEVEPIRNAQRIFQTMEIKVRTKVDTIIEPTIEPTWIRKSSQR